MSGEDMDGAVDLSALAGAKPGQPILGQLGAEARAAAEAQIELRCTGCGRRISTGYSFIGFRPELLADGPTITVRRAVACPPGPGCSAYYTYRESGEFSATEQRNVHWLDDDPLPASTYEQMLSEEETAAKAGNGPPTPEDEAFDDTERIGRARVTPEDAVGP